MVAKKRAKRPSYPSNRQDARIARGRPRINVSLPLATFTLLDALVAQAGADANRTTVLVQAIEQYAQHKGLAT